MTRVLRFIGFVLVSAGLAGPAAAQISKPAPQVDVTGGTIEGRIADDDALVFQGIPFAAPPLADLRWQMPQPVLPWTGVRAASALPPSCPQPDQGWNRADVARASEDCLTLDIRTPSLEGRRPVMLWIHGGSNRAGSSGGTVESRITDRGVVLVAIQYRLGILGFLAPRGAGDNGSAGNYGLMDQIAALRWVRAHIERFGGDPDNITIFGESAGSQDVSLLLAAPAAKDLFARAIMQSGTAGFGMPFRPLADAFATANQAQRLAGVKDISGLRALPVARLLQIDAKLDDPTLHSNDFLWLKTTIDGDVLPASPRTLLTEAAPKPVIIGSNRAEFGPAEGTTDIDATVMRVFGKQAAEARQRYRFGHSGHDPRLGHPGLEIETDWVFRCPAVTLASLLTRENWPVWTYEFDRSDDGGLTSHGADIGYIMDRRPVAPGASLQDYWVRFAANGNPNRDGLPAWPLYTLSDRQYLAITPAAVEVQENLRADICELRDEI